MYSPKFQTTVLLIIIFSLSFSAGLECYYCDYTEGITKNDDCKSNLRDEFVREVTREPGFPSRSNRTSKLFQAFIDNKDPKGGDAKQGMDDVPYCIKAADKGEGGVEVISRGGAYALPGLAGTCQEISEGGSGQLCMCNTDRCNSAKAIALNVGLVLVGAASALCKLHA